MAETFKLTAIIEARVAGLEAGMRRAEQIVSTSTKRLNTITQQFTPFAAIGKGLIGIQAINLALRATTGIVAAIQGDTEALEATVRSLPFGIGSIAGAALDLRAQITGSADEAERLERAMKANERLGGGIRSLRAQAAPAGLRGFERQRQELRQRTITDVRAVQGSGGDPRLIKKALDLQRIIFQDAMAQINEAEERAAQVSRQRVRDKFLRENRETEQAAQKKLQIQESLNRRLISLDAGIQVAQLQQQGRFLDAQLTQIQANFNARLAAAETTAEKERIARLGILELEAAKRASRRGSTEAAREIVLSRSAIGETQRGRGLAFGGDEEIKVKDQDSILDSLKRIVENTRNLGGAGAPAIAG